MRFVLTNDDGIDAAGLAALRQAVDGQAMVVAPRDHMSECGHRVTTKQAITIDQREPNVYAIGGTPADCARIALHHLLDEPARREQLWVLSGINDGGNLGADLYISGTVAAVREAAFHGVPGIAISHYRRKGVTQREPATWNRAVRWTRRILQELLAKPPAPGSFWNVNLPCVEGDKAEPQIVYCPRSRHPLPVKYQADGWSVQYLSGFYHQRSAEPGSDVAECFAGKITVSLIEI